MKIKIRLATLSDLNKLMIFLIQRDALCNLLEILTSGSMDIHNVN